MNEPTRLDFTGNYCSSSLLCTCQPVIMPYTSP